MTSEKLPAIYAPIFDRLPIGGYNLGVPLQNNIMQINVQGEATEGRLIVVKLPKNALIMRQDQEPLEVELCNLDTIHNEVMKVKAFKNAPKMLHIRQEEGPQDRKVWTPGDKKVEVADAEAFMRFIDTIGTAGLIKADEIEGTVFDSYAEL
jgi:hypothetical protein